jgi:all-trans-retinol 13,14-reductase
MDVDAVVIGSGAGGLTAALALARLGKRVVVFEQHYLPGGWCHSFNLEGYQFSPGVHYIGALGPGGAMRGIYEGLGLADDLEFLELDPDGYDRVRVAGEAFDIPRGKERLAERLVARFPAEAEGIRGYLDVVSDIARELEGGMRAKGWFDRVTLPFRMKTTLRHGLRSVGGYLDGRVHDPLLKAILTVQAGDHGVGPARAPLVQHAAVVAHYFDGAWYPRGGAKAIPRAYIRALKGLGGVVKVRSPVARILVERRTAIGVRLADGTEVRAPIVISNADAHATYDRLLAPEDVPPAIRRRLGRTRYSTSALSLFLAADFDARAAGLTSGNVWWMRHPDVDKVYADSVGDHLPERFDGGFLTTTTLKDPSERTDRLHTMEAFTFVPDAPFAKWAASRPDERPPDYEVLKEQLLDRMYEMLHHVVPGLRDQVVFESLGTPLTNRFYVAATRGNLYGTEKTLDHLGPWAYPVRTPISGLFHCGASTLGHGVAGVTFSGMAAALAASGASRRDVLTGRGTLRTYPSEHPEQWLDGKAAAKG